MNLVEDRNDYILTFEHGQVVYYFDKDNDNRLRLIDHPNGNNIEIVFESGDSDIDKICSRHDATVYSQVDVTCDGRGRITSINDAGGNTYSFTYSSGRLSSRSLPSSIGTRYYYYGDQNDINGTTVDLDDGGDTSNLTWIKDECGKIDAVFSYDSSDRIDFGGTGVVDNKILLYHELDYDTPSTGRTTVKGPSMGGDHRTTVMTWESWFGIGAVTANSNTGCGSCGGVGYWKIRTYDIDLNPLTSKSQTGIDTRWKYNSDGLVIEKTEDEGGADERLTEYTYDPTCLKVATVKTPSVYGSSQKITTYTWDSTYYDLTSVQESGYDWDGTSISRTIKTYIRDSQRRVIQVDGPLTEVDDKTKTATSTVSTYPTRRSTSTLTTRPAASSRPRTPTRPAGAIAAGTTTVRAMSSPNTMTASTVLRTRPLTATTQVQIRSLPCLAMRQTRFLTMHRDR